MSSNTPFMDSIEDDSKEKKMAKTKVPSEDKSGSASTVMEKKEKKIVKKYLDLHSINQGLLRKLKQNGQRNEIVKKDPYIYPVQMIPNCENRTQIT